jgi:glycosyltransferase involved in cell wall biosynthesis
VKKIKVLHVTFDMSIGGAQQVIRQLVENRDKGRFEIDIVCIDGLLGELGEILTEQGVSVTLLNRQSGFNFNLLLQLNKLVNRNGYQIVHCHQYTPYVYGLLASLFTRAKVVFTEHGRFYPDYGTWKRKLINPMFCFFTSKITTISKATKDALVQYENFDQSKIEVIYNGIFDMSQIEVDESKLKEQFSIPSSTFLLGTISRLQPIKNQEMMITAFKRVNDQKKNTHLLIVGDGAIRGQLTELVNDLLLEDHVTFTGFQKDPYRFHKIIDVFLLSSFSEGTSMTLLEAMAFSKPCIVTDVGGNPEVVAHNITGLVLPSNDIAAFVDGILKLISEQKLVKRYGSAGREIFLEKFTSTVMLRRHEHIYLDILAQ